MNKQLKLKLRVKGDNKRRFIFYEYLNTNHTKSGSRQTNCLRSRNVAAGVRLGQQVEFQYPAKLRQTV